MFNDRKNWCWKNDVNQKVKNNITRFRYRRSYGKTQIHSISGELQIDGIVNNRPFRMPHHTVTTTVIIGGGKIQNMEK